MKIDNEEEREAAQSELDQILRETPDLELPHSRLDELTDAIEEYDDLWEARRALQAIADGEERPIPWDEVKIDLGLS